MSRLDQSFLRLRAQVIARMASIHGRPAAEEEVKKLLQSMTDDQALHYLLTSQAEKIGFWQRILRRIRGPKSA